MFQVDQVVIVMPFLPRTGLYRTDANQGKHVKGTPCNSICMIPSVFLSMRSRRLPGAIRACASFGLSSTASSVSDIADSKSSIHT